MTATSTRPRYGHPKGILVSSSRNNGTCFSIQRRCPGTTICGGLHHQKQQKLPVLISPSGGKLKHLRNHYTRRRSGMEIFSPPKLAEPQLQRRAVSPLPSLSFYRNHANDRRRVRFQSTFLVHEIPSRKDYSKEEKEEIWIPRKELKQLIQKNHAESAYEGRDWRTIPEEDEFGINEQGELVHPMHLQNHSSNSNNNNTDEETAVLPCVLKKNSNSSVFHCKSPMKRNHQHHHNKRKRANRLDSLRRLPIVSQPTQPAVVVVSEEEEEVTAPDSKRPRSCEERHLDL